MHINWRELSLGWQNGAVSRHARNASITFAAIIFALLLAWIHGPITEDIDTYNGAVRRIQYILGYAISIETYSCIDSGCHIEKRSDQDWRVVNTVYWRSGYSVNHPYHAAISACNQIEDIVELSGIEKSVQCSITNTYLWLLRQHKTADHAVYFVQRIYELVDGRATEQLVKDIQGVIHEEMVYALQS
jgi:hypothetical protein